MCQQLWWWAISWQKRPISPKTRILARSSSASNADGPTLHLNLLQNVIPRTVVTLDWPECASSCGGGRYRGKNGQSCCPKTRILATLSIADGLTLQLNLLQNVIPRTVIVLDWPEYTHNSWDGQYRGKNGNLAPKDTFSPDRLVQQVSQMG